jgi:hypothetical protein
MEYFRNFRPGPDLTPEQLKKQEEYTEMMVTKSKVYTASIAEEASADFEDHAAAAADKREEVKIHQCQQCDYNSDRKNDVDRHVSTVVSRSVRVTHLFLSDLLCYVLLCVPSLQHDKVRNHPCQWQHCINSYRMLPTAPLPSSSYSYSYCTHTLHTMLAKAKAEKEAKKAKAAKAKADKETKVSYAHTLLVQCSSLYKQLPYAAHRPPFPPPLIRTRTVLIRCTLCSQAAAKKETKVVCKHGRHRCKDCGLGYCQHRRPKHQCKDCGTGHCQHGRLKSRCKDCGTGQCQHRRPKGQCKDCGTGYCQHGRLKYRCKDCGTGYCQHGNLKRPLGNKYRCKDCDG